MHSLVLIKYTFFFLVIFYHGPRFSTETGYQGDSIKVTEGMLDKSMYFAMSISLQ